MEKELEITSTSKGRWQEDPTTERVLKLMLVENTGRHMLDSGGVYGRSWERNQGRDFDSEPATVLECRYNSIDVTHNVYHWLLNRLEFDPDMQTRFDLFAEERPDDSWMENMEEFVTQPRFVGQEDGYGFESGFTVNTYNGECLLSQILQYTVINDGNDSWVLLQIHGGCDARGGYTAPKAFFLTEDGLWDNARGTICPIVPDDMVVRSTGLKDSPLLIPARQMHFWEDFPGESLEPYWMTDDGYHWYRDGSSMEKELNNYEFSENPKDRGFGVIYVDADGTGHCPITGFPLVAYE